MQTRIGENKTYENKRYWFINKFCICLKDFTYQKLKKSIYKVIKNKSNTQYKNLTNLNIDECSKLIFKTKDYSVEQQKNAIFKRFHERYFVKEKALTKVCAEMDQKEKNYNPEKNKKYTYYIDR